MIFGGRKKQREEEEVANHHPGDKTEAIYVSNLKGDNTNFYRFFREEEEEDRGRGRCVWRQVLWFLGDVL